MLRLRKGRSCRGRTGNAQHPHALARHRLHGLCQGGHLFNAKVTKPGDRLGCALGRDDERLRVVGLPDLGHGQKIRAKAVGMHEFPLGSMQVPGLFQLRTPQFMEGLLHRVVGFTRTGEYPEFQQDIAGLGQRGPGCLAHHELLPVLEPQFRNRHAVLRQRPGLVRAQHRRRTKCFDRGSAPGQHTGARDSPGTHRHEYGQHDRKLLR